MKKQKIFLKNKQLLGFYLVVGVLFSVISVVAPSISGELVNAVIYRQGDVKVYLFLLVLTYILLLLFSIADQYFFQYFQIKGKECNAKRTVSGIPKERKSGKRANCSIYIVCE